MQKLLDGRNLAVNPAFGRLAASQIGLFLLERGKRWQAALKVDRVDTVLIQAVISANLAGLSPRNARLDIVNRARRPTSIMGISLSMGVDYSTVRRRMTALAAKGLISKSGLRYIVPVNPLICGAPRSLADQDAVALYGLIEQMRSQGFRSLPSMDRLPENAYVGKAIIDFAVRSLEGFVEQHGSVTTGSIWAAIIVANVRHILNRELLPCGYVNDVQPLPDYERRPVTLREVALEAGLPFETVRRHVLLMANKGVVEIRREGLVVPTRVLAMEQQTLRSHLNVIYLRRLFSLLSNSQYLGSVSLI